jgi:putative PIN family toxin of toxin-antitoxin system
VKIVLDNTILVRAHERAHGLGRELLTSLVESKHTLLLSEEILHELARVLRYPRLKELFGLTEELVFNYLAVLRRSAEIVTLNPLLTTPIRDVNDVIVVQTAILGEADILCTHDEDFFQEAIVQYLSKHGINVLDDKALMARLRS